MAKPLSCPGCEAEYDAAGYDPGDQFECPACKEIVTVGGGNPASSAPRTAKMPSRGGTRRTASVPPAAPRDRTTSKMRVVNQAVGMGALDPNIDPKMIRRAGAQPPQPVSTGGDKTPMIIGAVLAAVVILGGVIYIARQPSADEKKAAAAKDKKKKDDDDVKPVVPVTAGTSTDPTKPRTNDVPGVTKQIQDHVAQILSLLKNQPVGPNFWKVAAPLLAYGATGLGEIIEHFNDGEQEVALAARAIVSKMTGWSVPEEPFYTAASRERIKADVYGSWQDKVKDGTLKLKSEAEFLADDGAVAVNPPPTDPPPNNGNPTPPPDGVVPKRPVGGGTSESAMRRDLPQYIANYATGTGDQQDEAIREVRKFGKPVVPALIEALKEEDTSRAKAAYSMLKEFTKQDFGVIPGDVADRTAFLAKWSDWWKANEATFSM